MQLLGETSLLGEQAGRAVKAYERAVTLRDDDLQIATGLVDAYIANGQQAKAVDYVNQLKATLAAATSSSSAAPAAAASGADAAASTSGAGEGDAAAAPAVASTSAPSSQPQRRQASRAIRPLEPVALDLLLAKTYSQWRGHDNDALATCVRLGALGVRAAGACRLPKALGASVGSHTRALLSLLYVGCGVGRCLWRRYDALIAAFPEDFRGYLAKGVFLRDKGRRADAERMFLQVRTPPRARCTSGKRTGRCVCGGGNAAVQPGWEVGREVQGLDGALTRWVACVCVVRRRASTRRRTGSGSSKTRSR